MRISDWSSDVCSSDLHVPHGSDLDITDLYERQIERYAPGFRDVVIARRVSTRSWYPAHNANLIGGDIAGGSHGGLQLDRQSVVSGKSVSARVNLGGRRIIKKNITHKYKYKSKT